MSRAISYKLNYPPSVVRQQQASHNSAASRALVLRPHIRCIPIPHRRPIQTRPKLRQIPLLPPNAVPTRQPRVLVHAHAEQRVRRLPERIERRPSIGAAVARAGVRGIRRIGSQVRGIRIAVLRARALRKCGRRDAARAGGRGGAEGRGPEARCAGRRLC
jgi:hypothetical protein